MNRKVKMFLSVAAILLLANCNEKSRNSRDTCLSPVIENTIKEYINEYENTIITDTENEIDTTYNYFCIYFHHQDENKYFTICQAPWPAYVLFPEVKEKDNPYYFLLFNIDNRTVYLISERSMPTDDLFKPCDENIMLAGKEENPDEFFIYDGSYYPQTYQYSKIEDEIIISKLEDPILDFKPGWKEFEDFLKENKQR